MKIYEVQCIRDKEKGSAAYRPKHTAEPTQEQTSVCLISDYIPSKGNMKGDKT